MRWNVINNPTAGGSGISSATVFKTTLIHQPASTINHFIKYAVITHGFSSLLILIKYVLKPLLFIFKFICWFVFQFFKEFYAFMYSTIMFNSWFWLKHVYALRRQDKLNFYWNLNQFLVPDFSAVRFFSSIFVCCANSWR